MSADRNADTDEDSDGEANANQDTDLALKYERELEQYPLFEWLGVGVEAVEPGRAVLAVPFGERVVNVSGEVMHGGITATVIDTASGIALRTAFEDPASASLTTTDMNVRYVRPVRDDVRVEADVVRAGESVGVTEAVVTTVHEGERKVVATGGTTYRLFREHE